MNIPTRKVIDKCNEQRRKQIKVIILFLIHIHRILGYLAESEKRLNSKASEFIAKETMICPAS